MAGLVRVEWNGAVFVQPKCCPVFPIELHAATTGVEDFLKACRCLGRVFRQPHAVWIVAEAVVHQTLIHGPWSPVCQLLEFWRVGALDEFLSSYFEVGYRVADRNWGIGG